MERDCNFKLIGDGNIIYSKKKERKKTTDNTFHIILVHSIELVPKLYKSKSICYV